MNKSKVDVSKIRDFLEERNLDAVIAANPITAAYLTNLKRFNHLTFQRNLFPHFPVFPRKGPPWTVGGNLATYLPESMRPAWIEEFYDGGSPIFEDNLPLLVKTLHSKDLATARIGIDLDSVPATAMTYLQRELPGAEFVDASVLFYQLRAKKTDREVEILKAALSALEAGYRRILKAVEPGRSMREIMKLYAQTVFDNGAEFMAPMSLEWYTEDSLPKRHIRFSKEEWILKRNEMVINVDTLGYRSGYWADNAIIFYLGTPPPEIEEKCDLKWRAVSLAASKMKRGMTAKTAFEVINEALERELGYDGSWDCHGIGLDVLEEPLIGLGEQRRESEEITLEPNTVLCIEAGLGAEQTYVMGEERFHCLSTLPQKLHIIT